MLRSHTLSTGGTHARPERTTGRPRTSTNVSASSLRHTNELHSGCSDGRSRPTSSPLGQRGEAGRDRPGGEQHRPPRAATAGAPHRGPAATAGRADAGTASAACSHHRHETAQLGQRARQPQPPRRSEGARLWSTSAPVRRSGSGGLPSHDVPRLALRGPGGRQHRDQALAGHLPARGRHPRVPEERVLADLHVADPQPPAAELVAAEQGVVGQEGTVPDGREPRDAAGPSRPRRRCPTSGAERPEPGRGQQAGVEREQPRPRLVQDRAGRDQACHAGRL